MLILVYIYIWLFKWHWIWLVLWVTSWSDLLFVWREMGVWQQNFAKIFCYFERHQEGTICIEILFSVICVNIDKPLTGNLFFGGFLTFNLFTTHIRMLIKVLLILQFIINIGSSLNLHFFFVQIYRSISLECHLYFVNLLRGLWK